MVANLVKSITIPFDGKEEYLNYQEINIGKT